MLLDGPNDLAAIAIFAEVRRGLQLCLLKLEFFLKTPVPCPSAHHLCAQPAVPSLGDDCRCHPHVLWQEVQTLATATRKYTSKDMYQ